MTIRLSALALVLVQTAAMADTADQQASAAALASSPSGSQSRDVRVAVGGDLLGVRGPFLQNSDPELAKIAAILRAADGSFANLEQSVFDLNGFQGWPAAETGAGAPQPDTPPGPLASAPAAVDLGQLGIRMVSRANNHALDWGIEGMFASERSLDSARLVHAGSGISRDAACAPAFFKNPNGKTIALVAAASTFTAMAPAGNATTDYRARPGLCAIHASYATLVTESDMQIIRSISARQESPIKRDPPPNLQEATFNDSTFDLTFRVADRPGRSWTVYDPDTKGVLESVAAARQKADLVVFSIHAHETQSGNSEDTQPAQFLPTLFHQVIDAGADLVVRTGPHALNGIEIYKGRPIFYGMASLTGGFGGTFEQNGVSYTLPDTWRESAIAVSDFRGGRLAEIRLYPIVFGRANNPQLRAMPRLAPREAAQRILERLKRESARFGTDVELVNDVGIIHPPAAS